jgi:hypothetical protein
MHCLGKMMDTRTLWKFQSLREAYCPHYVLDWRSWRIYQYLELAKINFLKDQILQWWKNNKEQELEVVASLTYVGSKELIGNRFTLEYLKFKKGMNLIQMKHKGFYKA